MQRLILVLNAGSSSLKFQVFALGDGELRMRMRGQIDAIGGRAHFAVTDAHGEPLADRALSDREGADQAACLRVLTDWLDRFIAGTALAGIGHRVVHGGALHRAPARIDARLLQELEALVPLAPLHQPFNLAPIHALQASHPQVPQVACFDTAFHRTQPLLAELFALPLQHYERGVRRYGFHGLSYEYVAGELQRLAPELAGGRVVVAHLGNGASMCALHHGKSVATTMGFTALDGLPMGTRCGSLDPGVMLYLARERGMPMDAIEQLLYRESGLLGLSAVSSDMRELLASGAPGARLAVDYFVYRIGRELGSLAAALGGLDALVFTAGIGENSAQIRAAVCERAAWLGLALDGAANQAGGPRLHQAGSAVSIWSVPTNEELMIARHTREVLNLKGS